jgi:hypothetical protein
MNQRISQALSQKSLGFALIGVVAIASGLVYVFFVRHLPTPPQLVISSCQSTVAGKRRLTTQSRLAFDLPDTDFTIESGTPDMIIGPYHIITHKGQTGKMEIAYGDLSFSRELESLPTFSKFVEQRDIRTVQGGVVGIDHWGYLDGKERWRYVKFVWGDEVGYRPASGQEAKLWDQVISSGCLLAGPAN